MLFDRGRCIFLTGMCIVLHIRYCYAWATACARSWCRSEQRSGEVCSSACSQFSVPSLQSIALCSNQKGTGAMLVVSKASRKSSTTSFAKGASDAPCHLIHYILSVVQDLGFVTFACQWSVYSEDFCGSVIPVRESWWKNQCVKQALVKRKENRKTQHKLKFNLAV